VFAHVDMRPHLAARHAFQKLSKSSFWFSYADLYLRGCEERGVPPDPNSQHAGHVPFRDAPSNQ
jgi:hypothetical protein